MYQWTYVDSYYDSSRPKKSSNQNGVNGENTDAINSTSSIEAIKSRLLACDSVNSIIAEMKGALNEIESHAADTETHNKSELQRCEPLNGVIDRVDHDDVKIEFKSSTEFCKNCLVKQQSCDSQKEHSSVDRNTQTENEPASEVKKSQTAKPIPAPPPMPNFLMSPMPSIVVTKAKDTISMQMEQQSILCTPQVMNSSAETTDDKENVPCTPPNIPIAPPLPTNYIGSSASSFCPPPPPMPMSGGHGPLPPPMPIPSDKNIWFKSDSKFPKTRSVKDLSTKRLSSFQPYERQPNTRRNQ